MKPATSRRCTSGSVPRWIKIGQPWELILVNDGSTDGVGGVARRNRRANDPRVKVIHFRRNFGQTAAMMAGFDFARGDIIIPMDGDLQNDPADIPAACSRSSTRATTSCSGWRKDRKDNAVKRNLPEHHGEPPHLLRQRRAAARLRLLAEGLPARGDRRRAALRRDASLPPDLRCAGTARASPRCDVRHYARTSGKSKYGLERVLKVLADLIVVKFLDRFQQKPMYLFGAAASVALLLSVLQRGIRDFSRSISPPRRARSSRRRCRSVCVITAVAGLMCILMGLLAEMIMRTFFESQGKRVYLVRATAKSWPK